MKLLDSNRSQPKPARANTFDSPTSTSFIHHDARIHDFDAIQQRRVAATLRPQTSDGFDRHSKAARMSFFEAFAIDAGEDVFSFPKPRSAKAAPKEIQLLASAASSREASPLIGVAFGSPSHPPQYWTRLSYFGPGSANATPRTPRFFESFADEPEPTPQPSEKTPSAWKRVGSIFRRSTKAKKQKIEQSPESLPRPSTAQRPKSRGRTLLSLGRKSGELLRRHELSDPQEGIEAPLTSPPTWLTWQSSPRLGSPLRKTHRSRPSKVSRVMADDATLRITIAPTHETSLIERPLPPPVPKLEMQLPSCQLERYSVMFEKVLDPKPSLLERRRSRMRLLDDQDTTATADDLPSSTLHLAERRPLGRSVTSPSLSTSHLFPSTLRSGPQSRAIAFHKPLALRRSNTTPILSISPLRQSFVATAMTPEIHIDSPVSPDDTASFPNTPPLSMDEDTSVHVFNDTLPSFQITDYEKSITNVWQTALPPPPHSSASSRFSVDVHKALESPRLHNRSRSFNSKDDSARPNGRQVQVAVARRVDIAGRDSQQLSGIRPKVIQVGAQAHQRRAIHESTAQ